MSENKKLTPDQEANVRKLKDAIDKMLKGIEYALDENYSRKAVSSRLRECRREAIKVLTTK